MGLGRGWDGDWDWDGDGTGRAKRENTTYKSGDEESELHAVGRDKRVVVAAGVERAAAGADGEQQPADLRELRHVGCAGERATSTRICMRLTRNVQRSCNAMPMRAASMGRASGRGRGEQRVRAGRQTGERTGDPEGGQRLVVAGPGLVREHQRGARVEQPVQEARRQVPHEHPTRMRMPHIHIRRHMLVRLLNKSSSVHELCPRLCYSNVRAQVATRERFRDDLYTYEYE